MRREAIRSGPEPLALVGSCDDVTIVIATTRKVCGGRLRIGEKEAPIRNASTELSNS